MPVRVFVADGHSRHFNRALVDPGSDDTIFPAAIVPHIGVTLRPDSGHSLRWGGQRYSLRFGDVELELSDSGVVWRWPAVVGFSDAPLQYRLLGYSGCLQFFDATFRGEDRILELATNSSFPGMTI